MSAVEARVPKPDPHAYIASALRTLETEHDGLRALSSRCATDWRESFVAAVDDHSPRTRPADRLRHGQIRHIARKIAATLASTGTPAFFVHAADASHGDLGMITTGRCDARTCLGGRDRRA